MLIFKENLTLNNTKTNNTESNFVYKNVTKLCNITSDQGLISMQMPLEIWETTIFYDAREHFFLPLQFYKVSEVTYIYLCCCIIIIIIMVIIPSRVSIFQIQPSMGDQQLLAQCVSNISVQVCFLVIPRFTHRSISSKQLE